MLQDKPIKFDNVNLKTHKWTVLSNLWKDSSLSFTQEDDGWHIKEELEGVRSFEMVRDFVSLKRSTEIDTYGLLGLSLINLEDKKVYITEGVSDYITTKLILPDKNVLGVTTLGGSKKAKALLISLFDEVVIISDSDATGLANAGNWKRFLTKYNIKTSLFVPAFKDITDQFIFNLKLDNTVYI